MTLEEFSYFVIFSLKNKNPENIKLLVMTLKAILGHDNNSIDVVYFLILILRELSKCFIDY